MFNYVLCQSVSVTWGNSRLTALRVAPRSPPAPVKTRRAPREAGKSTTRWPSSGALALCGALIHVTSRGWTEQDSLNSCRLSTKSPCNMVYTSQGSSGLLLIKLRELQLVQMYLRDLGHLVKATSKHQEMDYALAWWMGDFHQNVFNCKTWPPNREIMEHVLYILIHMYRLIILQYI